MGILFCNNVATTLSAAITTTGQTSITVTSATGMPAPGGTDWFYLTLSDGAVNNPETAWEVVKVTAVSGTTLTIVRAQDNTTAQTWPNGAYIQARPCVQEVRDTLAGGITTLGDTDYCSATQSDAHSAGTVTRLPGNTSATMAVLTQTGNGTISAAPVWTASTNFGMVANTNTWSLGQTFTQGFTCTAYAGGSTNGQFWYDSTQLAPAVYANSLKQMLVGCIFTQTATGTNGANTAITNILGTGVGTAVLPSSYSLAGKTIRVRVTGTVITAASPGTTIITLRFNAGTPVTIVATPSLTLLASMASPGWPFEIELLITFRSATSVMAGGHFIVSSSTSGITGLTIPIGTATAATIVAATSYTIQVCATDGTASGTIYTAQTCSIEILN